MQLGGDGDSNGTGTSFHIHVTYNNSFLFLDNS